MYFYHIYYRKLQSALDRLEGKKEKINFLEANLKVTNQDIYCIENKVLELLTFTKKSDYKCSRFENQYNTYKKYLSTRIKYSKWDIVFAPFNQIIIWIALLRFLNRLKKEKIRYRGILEAEKSKVNREIEPDGNQFLLFETLTALKENEDDEIFNNARSVDINTIEVKLRFNYRDYIKGYSRLTEIFEALPIKDRINALNEMREDLERLVNVIEKIDKKLLKSYTEIYRGLILKKPEIVALIEVEARLLQQTGKTVITITEIIKAIKNRAIKFYAIINNLEEQIKLIEAERSLKTKKEDNTKDKIIWLGSETELMDLFFLLSEERFLAPYDESYILSHFIIIEPDGREKTNTKPAGSMTWFKSDNEFVQLISELEANSLIPAGKKWKNVEKHFVNNEQEPFNYLAQKKYALSTQIKENPIIKDIVKKTLKI